jgi:uncharacterized repeat protein (TIGR02543 family)/LPXTG-motif cell wall-anchored protein
MEKVKKIGLVGLILLMVISLGSTHTKTVYAKSMEPDYVSAILNSYGSGTSADPYRIYYLKQFAGLVIINTEDSNAYRSCYYILMNDLDFSDANNDGTLNDPYVAPNALGTGNWVPIGTSSNYRGFTGNFNGKGHTIKNLKIDAPSQDYVGLFSHLFGGGSVTNLHLDNVDIKGNNQVGGISGLLYASGWADNVSVSGKVSGNWGVGGIAGQIQSTIRLSNVYNTADITGSVSAVGGIAGYAYSANGHTSITNAYNFGTVTLTGGDMGNYGGGILGTANGETGSAQIVLSNVYNKGLVSGVATIGNLLGRNWNYLTVTNGYYPEGGLDAIGSNAGTLTQTNMGTYSVMATLLESLNAWVTANQTDPISIFPWRLGSGDSANLPVFNDVLITSSGNTTYTTSGASVTIDSNISVLAAQTKKLVITIDNVKTGDSLSFVDANGIVGSVYSAGKLELTSVAYKTGAEFQTAARTVKFSTTGEVADRKISFTINNGSEDISSTKTIEFTSFKVTYDDNGSTSGSVPTDSKEYLSGASVTVLGNIESLGKEGYSFSGWTKGATTYVATDTFSISADVTLVAKWSPIDYTITYYLNSGTNDPDAPTGYTIASSVITLPTPTRYAYEFEGWYTDSEFTEGPIAGIASGSTGNKSYYAKWTVGTYSIEFDSNSGSAVDTITQVYDSAVTKPTDPTRANRVFEGWYSDEELTSPYTFSKMPGENITLYASWSYEKYEVIFVDYDDTELSKQSIEFEEPAIEPDHPSRSGYQFKGWDKSFDEITEATTIKAVYEEIQSYVSGTGDSIDVLVEGLRDAVEFTEDELNPLHGVFIQMDLNIRTLDELSEAEIEKITEYEKNLLDNGVYTTLFMDIQLYKNIDEGKFNVTETLSLVKISFLVPVELRDKEFELLRIHTDGDGVTTYTTISYDYDPETFILSFETNQFSIFGLVSASAKLPNTGHENDVNSVSFLLMSLLVGLLVMKKKIKLS